MTSFKDFYKKNKTSSSHYYCDPNSNMKKKIVYLNWKNNHSENHSTELIKNKTKQNENKKSILKVNSNNSKKWPLVASFIMLFLSILFYYIPSNLSGESSQSIELKISTNENKIAKELNFGRLNDIELSNNNQIKVNKNTNHDKRKFINEHLWEENNTNSFISIDDISDLSDPSSLITNTIIENFLVLKNEKSSIQKVRTHRIHIIKKENTLWGIANQYKVHIDSIVSLNRINPLIPLKIGSTLNIPQASGLYYQVKRYDTLSSIAKKYQISMEEIKKYNQIRNYLHIGSTIFLPSAKFFDQERKKIYQRLFIRPVTGYVSSKYGIRVHPILKKEMFHSGIDIAGNNRAKVKSAASGKVIFTGKKRGYGNYIIIQHKWKYQTSYAHLYKINVKKGQKVSQGETIGTVGNTGRSTGAHLHFEIKHKGKYINPKQLISF